MPETIIKRVTLIVTHMRSLKTRHAILDGQIDVEHTRPAPDQQKLQWLKVRRLMVRDQIARYETLLLDLRSFLAPSDTRKAVPT